MLPLGLWNILGLDNYSHISLTKPCSFVKMKIKTSWPDQEQKNFLFSFFPGKQQKLKADQMQIQALTELSKTQG